jgi:galactose-1-phosphate uridylyltransferase
MKATAHLHFDSNLGRQKPESIVNRSTVCPFCDRENLKDILAADGPILLVKNKYPTLRDTFQTELIETDDCDSELSLYSREHLHRLIRFGVSHWLEMEQCGNYQSVLFYKNHGPLSGGTIHHPHMQIVGLKHIDYKTTVMEEHFEGLRIGEKNGVEFNISTRPRMGFFEYNVRLSGGGQIDQMADYIQIAAHYVLNHFNKNCSSYNLFFYQLDSGLAAKIVPRFPASPLFVGYSIPQVSDRIQEVAEEIRNRYLDAEKP